MKRKGARNTQVRREIEPREVGSPQDALERAPFLPSVPGKGEGPDTLQGSHYEANMYFVCHVFMFSL